MIETFTEIQRKNDFIARKPNPEILSNVEQTKEQSKNNYNRFPSSSSDPTHAKFPNYNPDALQQYPINIILY